MALTQQLLVLSFIFFMSMSSIIAQSDEITVIDMSKGRPWEKCERRSGEPTDLLELLLERKRMARVSDQGFSNLVNLYGSLFSGSNLSVRLSSDNQSLCMAIDIVTDWWQGKQFTFSLTRADGLTVKSTTYKAEIYEPPEILSVEDVIAKEGDPATIECIAKGSPNLVVKLISSIPQIGEKVSKAGESSVSVSLDNATRGMESEFECQASVSKENKELNSSSMKRKFTVQFPPKVSVDASHILTDAEVKEVITVTVEANPQGDLNCSLLTIPEERVIQWKDKSKHVYQVIIKVAALKPKDAGLYTCQAYNDLGSDSVNVSLILGPISVKISPPSMQVNAVYCNYHLLSWTMQSRAPIKESTIQVTRLDDQTTTEQKVVMTNEYPGELAENKNWLRTIRTHIANLTENKAYNVTLVKVCNIHNCWERTIGDPETVMTLKTPACKAKGEVSPTVLRQILNAKDGVPVTPPGDNDSIRMMSSNPIMSLLALCIYCWVQHELLVYL